MDAVTKMDSIIKRTEALSENLSQCRVLMQEIKDYAQEYYRKEGSAKAHSTRHE